MPLVAGLISHKLGSPDVYTIETGYGLRRKLPTPQDTTVNASLSLASGPSVAYSQIAVVLVNTDSLPRIQLICLSRNTNKGLDTYAGLLIPSRVSLTQFCVRVTVP